MAVVRSIQGQAEDTLEGDPAKEPTENRLLTETVHRRGVNTLLRANGPIARTWCSAVCVCVCVLVYEYVHRCACMCVHKGVEAGGQPWVISTLGFFVFIFVF